MQNAPNLYCDENPRIRPDIFAYPLLNFVASRRANKYCQAKADFPHLGAKFHLDASQLRRLGVES